MNNTVIFGIVCFILYVVSLVYVTYANKKPQEINSNEILSKLKTLAESYVHYFQQTDTSGHDKMNNVVSAVISSMNHYNYNVSPQEEEMIRAFAQAAYDKMTNSDKVANSAGKTVITADISNSEPIAIKTPAADETSKNAPQQQPTYEAEINPETVTDLQAQESVDTEAPNLSESEDNTTNVVTRKG